MRTLYACTTNEGDFSMSRIEHMSRQNRVIVKSSEDSKHGACSSILEFSA